MSSEKLALETKNVSVDEAFSGKHNGARPGLYVVLGVSDDGCGMPPDVLEHIFEPFFTTKAVGEGTGLGLATVYGIVKQNNDFISVDSEPEHGSCFQIYLPVHEHAAVTPAAVSQEQVVRGNGETILLVEDEAAQRDMCSRMLQQLGFTVLSAASPGEAVRCVHSHRGPIDLLITDVVMPEMNGKVLSERLSSLRPSLKHLFISGYAANIIAQHGVLEEGVNFLQKPYTKGGLAAAVHIALSLG